MIDSYDIFTYATDECGIKIKDGETVGEVYDKIAEQKNVLPRDELKSLGYELLGSLEQQCDFHSLRVFKKYPLIRFKQWHGFEEEQLYHKINTAIGKMVDIFCIMKEVERNKMNDMLLEHYFQEAYAKKYGRFTPTCETITLIKLIKDHGYDAEYARFLEDDLKNAIYRDGDLYFQNLDLTDRRTLKMLYRVVGESAGFQEFRRSVFYDYDGYGNVVCNVDR